MHDLDFFDQGSLEHLFKQIQEFDIFALPALKTIAKQNLEIQLHFAQSIEGKIAEKFNWLWRDDAAYKNSCVNFVPPVELLSF